METIKGLLLRQEMDGNGGHMLEKVGYSEIRFGRRNTKAFRWVEVKR